MKIIGITGLAGSGKDTIADHLILKHGFVRYGFSDPLKAMLDVIGVDCRTRETKEVPDSLLGVSPRRMMQTLGTEWGRSLHPDFWLLLADVAVRGRSAVVVPDVRFVNEAKWIKKNGGQIWRVLRPNLAAVESHSSESGLPDVLVDHTFLNISSIDHLLSRVTIRVRHPE